MLSLYEDASPSSPTPLSRLFYGDKMQLHEAVAEAIREVRRDPGQDPVKVVAERLQVSGSIAYKWQEDPAGSGEKIPICRARDLQAISNSPALAEWLLAGSLHQVQPRMGTAHQNGSVQDEGIAMLESAAKWLKYGRRPIAELAHADRQKLRETIKTVQACAGAALAELEVADK